MVGELRAGAVDGDVEKLYSLHGVDGELFSHVDLVLPFLHIGLVGL